MVSLGQEQKLGRIAFFLMLVRAWVPAFLVLILLSVLGIFKGVTELWITESIISVGAAKAVAMSTSASMVTYIFWATALLTFVLFILGYVIAYLQYKTYTFTFQEFDLKLKRGIFHLEEISIPFRQMQDVNVDRSLLYRFLGVSRILIDSAGHEMATPHGHNDAHITLEPIDKNIAQEILTLLQKEIGVQITQDKTVADKEAGI